MILTDRPVPTVPGPVTCLTLSRNRFQRLFGEDTSWGARYAREAEEAKAHGPAADGHDAPFLPPPAVHPPAHPCALAPSAC